MKRAVVIVAAVWAFVGAARGEQGGNGAAPAGAVKPAETPQERGEKMAKRYLDYIGQAADFTDDQKAKITELYVGLVKEGMDLQAKTAGKTKVIEKMMKEAAEQEDQDGMERAVEEYQLVFEPMRNIIKRFHADLDKVITPEQKAKIKDWQLTEMIKDMIQPVELTETQMKRVKASARGLEYAQQYAAVQESLDSVLTTAQKVAIKKPRAMETMRALFGPAKLTADQLRKAESACDAILKDATLKQEEVNAELQEKTAEILTPEQQAAMENQPPQQEPQ